MNDMSNASKTATAYLKAFFSGDFSGARELVAEGFSFKGPLVEVKGREAFFASAARLAPLVRGHHLLHQWADGDEVCSIYEMRLESPLGAGAVPVSEWHTVRDGRIVAARVLYDTTAFRAIVPAPASVPAPAPVGA